MLKPELVLPAGNLEKLKTALLFGASAVYMGGTQFSLRAYADNLSVVDMAEGLNFAHKLNKKVYVTVNIFAHNKDIKLLPKYLETLQQLGVDGIIVSDFGVLRLAKKYAPDIPITISTQANVTNYESALLYKELGARRIVLARELTLEEIRYIKDKADIELEIFVHGAMCVSYSGRCLLSHYMTGRSANLGACAHPCRYKYSVVEEKRPGEYYGIEEDERGSYIFNSKDLCLIEYIPQLIQAGIDSFKIEGRMKSPLYVATVAKTYTEAINRYFNNKEAYADGEIMKWMKELQTVATRPFTNGFIEGESDSIQDINKNYEFPRTAFCGVVIDYDNNNSSVVIEQRYNFGIGDELEIITPQGDIIGINLTDIFDNEGNKIDRARHPQQIVYIPFEYEIPKYSILRRVGS